MALRLFLLDGMALAYRAHFAFVQRPIRTSKGFNTSALFGFTTALLDILETATPTHLAVAFDTAAPTPRHVAYPAYKAQRDAMPEELVAALPHLRRLLDAFRIPQLILDGFEADDLIGTLVHQTEPAGFESFMVTPDKDFGQLVTERTLLWKPGRQGSDVEILRPADICTRWGIARVAQVVDMLGLMGDASDNIPGVPGVGEKTAAKLLAQYDTLENVLAHASEVKGRLGEALRTHADLARLSKQLATIITDAPLNFADATLQVQPRDDETLRALCTEFEFNAIGRRLFGDDFKAGRGGGAAVIPRPRATATRVEGAPIGAQGDLFNASPAPQPAAPGRARPPAKPADPAPQRQPVAPPQDSPQPSPIGGPPAPTDPIHSTTDQPSAVPQPAAPSCRTLKDLPHTYHLVASKLERQALAEHLRQHPAFCFDTETDGLDPRTTRLLGVAFSCATGQGWYLPVTPAPADTTRPDGRRPSPPELAPFAELFANPQTLKIGHNLKFDLLILRWHDVEVAGPFFDTMIAHALVDPELRHGMDYLAEVLLGYSPIPIEQLIGPKGEEQRTMAEVPVEQVAEYSAEDADVTWQLHEHLRPRLKERGQERVFFEVEMPVLPALVAMEFEGFRLDSEALAEFGLTLARDLAIAEADIHRLAGREFNVNSNRQLGTVLFDELRLVEKPRKTPTGQYATDEQTLQTLAAEHPIVARLLDYRSLAKLKSTYADALPAAVFPPTGRIHTTFHQAATATGRLSSVDPNLQNIPIRTERGQEIRRAFIARAGGCLLSADYSQIELRIIAALARENAMIEAFRRGDDIHAATAARVFGVPSDAVTPEMRRRAKMVNFGIAYGISAFGLAQRLGIPRGEAAELIDHYFQTYPGIRRYMEETIAGARARGFVETLTGRRRPLRDINSANATIRGAAERNAINTPIQGTAADMIKIAMARIHTEFASRRLRSRLVLQVHDELVFDLHREEHATVAPLVEEAMRTALPLPGDVPIVVELGSGPTWLDAH